MIEARSSACVFFTPLIIVFYGSCILKRRLGVLCEPTLVYTATDLTTGSYLLLVEITFLNIGFDECLDRSGAVHMLYMLCFEDIDQS